MKGGRRPDAGSEGWGGWCWRPVDGGSGGARTSICGGRGAGEASDRKRSRLLSVTPPGRQRRAYRVLPSDKVNISQRGFPNLNVSGPFTPRVEIFPPALRPALRPPALS